MSKKKIEENPTGFQTVENALSKTEQYIEENQKSLTIILLAIVIVIGGYLGYKKFYLEPANKDALEAMYVAENYFEQDSFQLALDGDGANYGFLDVIDEYSITKTANLAHYYAGVCYMRTGDFESAIDHLEKFDGEDIMVGSLAIGAIGDCNLELGNKKEAAELYLKAAIRKKNSFTSPIFLKKAGLVYEDLKEYDKAMKAYSTIKKDYPETEEGKVIDKYIAALEIKMK
ncbi:MAG TPA: tetratricopeptide repeat protein [Bacteroidales bacterium]|jgi:TolA-binding protein|nr:tetratricopeptide repeat protein [Bacteroidales bacterium]